MARGGKIFDGSKDAGCAADPIPVRDDLGRGARFQCAQTGMIPGSGDTAGIVWLGYDAPDTIPRAIGAGYARDGAPDLRDFTEGLRESSQNPDARTTVIGHSYGSTVVGHAVLLGAGLRYTLLI